MIGEKITTYIVDGVVDIHDDYGHWLETDNGILIIKMSGEKVVEVNREHFMTLCIDNGAPGGYREDSDRSDRRRDLLGRNWPKL